MCQLCKQYVQPEFEAILHGEEEMEFEDEQGYEFGALTSLWERLGSTQTPVAPATNDKARLSAAYAQGTANENDLSNMLFYVRHPELTGKKLTSDMPNFSSLSQEWLKIRDTIVRPFLDEKRSATGGAVIGTPDSSGRMPPIEGPVKGITGYIGASGKKCWKGAKSADIVDSDAPWNKPGNRSAANYIAVLDYLNVGETDSIGTGNSINKPGENPRYRQEINSRGGVSTWCNIYVHDATRAMWASMPHWVKLGSGQWNELTANAMVDWVGKYGQAAGWFRLLGDLSSWIQRAGIPEALKSVARRILTSSSDSSLLSQPSYLAQQFANMGYPTACIWNNPGSIGHVAMVRPEDLKKGKLVSGVFIPRSAQAGAKNYSNGYLVFGPSGIKSGSVQFHVHE